MYLHFVVIDSMEIYISVYFVHYRYSAIKEPEKTETLKLWEKRWLAFEPAHEIMVLIT